MPKNVLLTFYFNYIFVQKIKFVMNKLILLILLSMSSNSFSQIKISGKIVNKENFPVEYAEIYTISKDSILLKREFSNSNGEFMIDANLGWNKLQIRQGNW